MTRKPIKMGIRGGEGLCCSSTHLVQCEPDEPSLSPGVINAAPPLEGGPAETGGLTQDQWPEGRLKCGLGEKKAGQEPRLDPGWSM